MITLIQQMAVPFAGGFGIFPGGELFFTGGDLYCADKGPKDPYGEEDYEIWVDSNGVVIDDDIGVSLDEEISFSRETEIDLIGEDPFDGLSFEQELRAKYPHLFDEVSSPLEGITASAARAEARAEHGRCHLR